MLEPLSDAEWKVFSLVAQATAGRGRGGLVLSRLSGRVLVDERDPGSALHFDERTLMIDKLVLGRVRSPYIMAHEFGHAYHCYFWPVLSALMPVPNPRAEAVAYLFEMELQAYAARHWTHRPPKAHPSFGYLATSAWQARRQAHHAHRRREKEPFDILEQMLQNPSQHFHTLVGRIVQSDGR